MTAPDAMPPGPSRAPAAPRRIRNALVAAAVVAIPVALWAGAAWHMRGHTLAAAAEDMAGMADTVAEHATRMLETQALVLDIVDRAAGGRPCAELRADAELQAVMAAAVRRAAQTETVWVLGADGHFCAASEPARTDDRSRAFREYFTGARDAGPDRHFIGRAIMGLIVGAPAFNLARSRGSGGEFSGIVLSAVNMRDLLRYWREVVAVGPTQRVALYRADGAVVARSWEPHVPAADAGLEARRAAVWRDAPKGTRVAPSVADGVPRVFAWRVLPDWGVAVSASVSLDEAMRPWHQWTLYSGLAALLASGLLAAFVWSRARASARLQRNNAALEAEVARRTASLAALNAELERRVEERTEQVVQLQKLESLGRLTGGVAHDFNNLLQGVGSCLFVLDRHVPEGPARALFDAARQSVERGAGLTRSLLAFARRQTLVLRSTDVGALLEGMRPLLERTLGGKVEVAVEVRPGTSPALADPHQLESAVLNLAINARDAMPLGGRLTLKAEDVAVAHGGDAGAPRDLAPGDYVAVSAEDTGTGMDAATLERVFEPFFTTKEVGMGSGLGLSMVHGMAAQSGGGVAIASTPGLGTTVTVYLRRAASEPLREARAPAAVAHGAGQTVLLVDDDELVRLGTRAMLEGLGYRVLSAGGGGAALEILRGGAGIDALVTDYAMPGMDGAALVREARRIAPGLPALMVTGYPSEVDGVEGVRVLPKPFRADDLAARLVEALRRGRAEVAGDPVP